MNQKNKTIVIIDDDIGFLKVLEGVLVIEGYNIVKFSKMPELKEINVSNPLCFLVDVWLTDRPEGIQFARMLRHSEQFKDAKILMMSSDISTMQITKNIKNSNFIPKPIKFPHLIRMLEAI